MYRWPQDFIPFEEGRLRVRPDAVASFERRGWTCSEAILVAPEFQYNRWRPYFGGWDTGCARLAAASDRRAQAAQGVSADRGDSGRNRDLWVYIKRFRTGFHGWSSAFREAEQVRLLQSAGVPCLEVVAVGRVVRRSVKHPYRSFLMTERVGAGESVVSRLQALRCATPRTADIQRRALLMHVAELVARMHAVEVYHGDCKWLHVVLEEEPERWPSCRFIDLERARKLRGPLGFYAWIRDLEQCERSLRIVQAAPAEIDGWYRAYEAAYAAAKGPFAALRGVRRAAQRCRRVLVWLRKPFVRAVHLNGHRTIRAPGYANGFCLEGGSSKAA